MKIFFMCGLFVFSGCSATNNIDNVGSQEQGYFAFKVSANKDQPSELVKNLSEKFCRLKLHAIVSKVHSKDGQESFSKIEFSNSDSNKKIAVVLYYDRSTKDILPLIKHSDDDYAEPLGMRFSLGEEIFVMIFKKNNEFGVSLEPAIKVKNILSSIDKNNAHSEHFKFSILEIDFQLDAVAFLGVSIESTFENISFTEGC